MAEPLMGVNLGPQPCYPFYQRMVTCAKTEEVARMCMTEAEDFKECKTRTRARAFNNYLHGELRKMKIYSLPKYDEHTDTFVDGDLPKDIDGYFSKDKSERQYYS